MEKLLRIATNELGIREYPGVEHNARILKYSEDIGMTWVVTDETPWCSIFLNWVAHRAKYERSNKANAKSWLSVGIGTENPEPGDIGIYSRGEVDGPLGHVGFFLGFSTDQARIYTLGGNQGNSVSISAYDRDLLIEFRRLRELKPRLSTQELTRGHKGPKVAALQDALKMAGYNCGTSDGYYGAMTEKAVKRLQGDARLTEDGVFNKKTRGVLKAMIVRTPY